MRGVWTGVMLCALLGCSAVEGPLLVSGEGDASIAPGSGDAGAIASPVQPGMRIQYQITGTVDESVDVELIVIDLFDATPALVQRLHDRGRVVVGYLAAGSHEPFRSDSDAFPVSALGAPLADYPSERWLDVRDATVRSLMQARIQLGVDRGFDGILFSSLAAYEVDSGHDLTAADQLDYNRFLAARAHAAGLAAGIADDWGQASELAPAFDFAIHSGCIASGQCAQLDPYRAAGKAVFDLETSGTTAEVCAEAAALSLPVTLKRGGWGASLEACP